jgi:N-methylhydantoinase B
MPAMMQALLRHPTARWSPGIMWLCNDPRVGGTHLPDLTLIAPVYAPASSLSGKRVRIGFVASRAHHADIGGLSPGSLPLSTELFHEGLVLPPVALVERGKVREEIVRLVCANSRTPEERRGDLAAQIAANETGIRRMQALYGRTAGDAFALRARENLDYAERMVRRALAQLPAGTYHAEDVLDGTPNDALPLPIQVAMTVRSEGSITFDFTGSAPQTAFSLNATEAITRSACYYVVRCLVEDDIPTNEGCFRPVEVIAPEGSIVHARFPAAVAAGNVETSQRIVDVLLKALAQAAPERAPAASQGTMNNLTLGGFDPVRQRSFAYYETIAGGIGASAQGAGASAMHAHMTNTRNTPVEALETHYPLRVREYALAEGTGGQGEHPGGNGLIRRIELLAEAQVSFLGERRRFAPFGAAGGGAGASGSETLQLPGQAPETLFGKWSRFCPARTLVTIRTPGGGGWGGSG